MGRRAAAPAAVWRVMRDIHIKRQRHDTLVDALRTLYDLQNGAPLVECAAEWEAAMAKAREALLVAEGGSAPAPRAKGEADTMPEASCPR